MNRKIVLCNVRSKKATFDPRKGINICIINEISTCEGEITAIDSKTCRKRFNQAVEEYKQRKCH